MWLQLRQVLKKFTKGNARKFTVGFTFCAHVDVIKIEKHQVPVVQRLDNAIHRINRYPVDKC